ncbi:winged helix-turn-helix domain-containing protein [Actinokineospora sp. HUAS TT18]|uniref:winged helix-turn-helix domain-containing protein n=1 Tax=Actinokineospora sp. HUAS TT18 TaxID=3447451 RepID=UPI003F51F67F
MDGPVVICVGVPAERLTAVAEAAGVPVVFLPDADALRAGLDEIGTGARRVVECGKLRLDADLRELTWCGRPVPISAREFDLLFALANSPGRVWTFAELTNKVWGRAYVGDAQAVVSAVKRLRRALRENASGVRVEAVRGVGYRVVVGDPTSRHDDWPWRKGTGG